jgi:CO/xanthine dehydrogenase FAD-binding subunit
MLAAAAALIGHSHVRNRGTIGGSVAHADPAAEWPVALTALGATVVAVGPGGRREVPITAFVLGPLTTVLAPDELLTEIRVPIPGSGHRWAFREFTIRSGDFALASAAVLITAGDAGPRARIVVGGTAAVPAVCPAAEAVLAGDGHGDAALVAAARTAAAEVDAADDDAGSGAYRRRIVEVLVRDALRQAVARPPVGGAAA